MSTHNTRKEPRHERAVHFIDYVLKWLLQISPLVLVLIVLFPEITRNYAFALIILSVVLSAMLAYLFADNLFTELIREVAK